jgi:hypothetical protein
MTIIALTLKYAIERWHFLVNHQGQTISYLLKEKAFENNEWLNLTVGNQQSESGYAFRMAYRIFDESG